MQQLVFYFPADRCDTAYWIQAPKISSGQRVLTSYDSTLYDSAVVLLPQRVHPCHVGHKHGCPSKVGFLKHYLRLGVFHWFSLLCPVSVDKWLLTMHHLHHPMLSPVDHYYSSIPSLLTASCRIAEFFRIRTADASLEALFLTHGRDEAYTYQTLDDGRLGPKAQRHSSSDKSYSP